jgi:plasmid stabilization system protein ParE
MIERVVVRAWARRDIREARLWYRNISYDLGESFLRSVAQAAALALEHPLAFHATYRKFRRVLLKRFPYALFYRIDKNRMVIVAVLHQARDPRELRKR